MKLRLSTLMLIILIVGLAVALVVQGRRAARREAEFQARLDAAIKYNAVTKIELMERDYVHQIELARLRSAALNPSGTEKIAGTGRTAKPQ